MTTEPGSNVISKALEVSISSTEKITKCFSFLLLVLISATVLAGVISRYIFNSALTWTEELAAWTFFWLICMAIINGHIGNNHISIDLFNNYLSRPGQKLKQLVVTVIVCFSTLMLLSASWEFLNLIGGKNVSLGISNAIKVAPLPIVCIISFIFILGQKLEGISDLLIRLGAFVVSLGMWILIDYGDSFPQYDVQPSLMMAIIFVICIALGAPISFSMILATFTATASADLLPPPAVVQNMVAGGGKFILLAIPFFLSAGYLMNIGGLSNRMLDFASTLVSQYRGGLAKVNIINSLLIGGISGSSGADAASTTKVLVPEMEKRGYDAAFSCAVTASSAVLPNIIPPAITMLVLASVADISIAKLFVAGLGPGLLIAILMLVVVQIMAKRRGYESGTEKCTAKQRLKAFLHAFPALLLVIWIIGGIRFGIVTATEAGVVGMIWAVFLGAAVYREYGLKDLYTALTESAVDAGLIGFLIAVSTPFAWVMIADQVPQQIVSWAANMNLGQSGFLIVISCCMLILGTFMDVSVTILIAVPLFLPLAKMTGIDLSLFGIVVILGAIMGNITPPVGILVFISSSIARIPPSKVFVEVLPFLLSIMVGILMVIYNEWICTGLWTLLN